jgi:SAM-dependent methyltransferase
MCATEKDGGLPGASASPSKSTVDFDRYTHDYREQVERSFSFIRQDHEFFVRIKVGHLLDLTRRRVGNPKQLSILDVGCGVGLTDRHLVGEFGNVWGADISDDSIKVAAANTPGANYRSYDGMRLPFEDDEFDVSFAIGVLHHVPPSDWARFMDEMARVTSAAGLIVVFEHNPYNPLTRLAVGRCEFDEGVVLLSKSTTRRLFTGARLSLKEEAYIIVLPWALPVSDRIEAALKRVPLGAQYFVAGAKSTV